MSWAENYAVTITYSGDSSGVKGYRLGNGNVIISILTAPATGKLYFIGSTWF